MFPCSSFDYVNIPSIFNMFNFLFKVILFFDQEEIYCQFYHWNKWFEKIWIIHFRRHICYITLLAAVAWSACSYHNWHDCQQSESLSCSSALWPSTKTVNDLTCNNYTFYSTDDIIIKIADTLLVSHRLKQGHGLLPCGRHSVGSQLSVY